LPERKPGIQTGALDSWGTTTRRGAGAEGGWAPVNVVTVDECPVRIKDSRSPYLEVGIFRLVRLVVYLARIPMK